MRGRREIGRLLPGRRFPWGLSRRGLVHAGRVQAMMAAARPMRHRRWADVVHSGCRREPGWREYLPCGFIDVAGWMAPWATSAAGVPEYTWSVCSSGLSA
jgi:hypothetical protein